MSFVCYRSDLHPYECGQNCIHCRKAVEGSHHPATCAFCWMDLVDREPALVPLFIEIFDEPRKQLKAA